MKWCYRVGLAVSALTLLTGVAAAPASAIMPQALSSSTDTDIEGNYYWNGDGFTGNLDIYSQVNGNIKAVLTDNGQTENLTGAWTQAINELVISRPLTDGTVQTYAYFLGGSPYSVHGKMFGGSYKSANSGPGSFSRGSYLDSTLTHPASTPNVVSPNVETNIVGNYYWNGDGYVGNLNIYSQQDMTGTPGNATWQIYATLTDNGQSENLHGEFFTFTDNLVISRPLPDGSGTQTYDYWLGGSPYNTNHKMFGGYFGEAGNQTLYGTYLDSAL